MANHLILTLIFSVFLSSCSSPIPTYYYQLDALAGTPSPALETSTAKKIIGIGPTTLPNLLNRKAIVTRTQEQTIRLSPTEQWAEPLIENIPRTIARNLALLQPNSLFHVYPWQAFGAVDQRIVLEIFQFDGQLGKSVIFEAAWSIKDEHSQNVIKQSRTRLERPFKSNSYAEMVANMNELLNEFSHELARHLPE